MNLIKLYELQKDLDTTILDNIKKRTGKEIDKGRLLFNTLLALQVEVSEFANATRCFKHWSIKEAEEKEILLEELADIFHFYLSIGNQIGVSVKLYDYELYTPRENLIKSILKLNSSISKLVNVIGQVANFWDYSPEGLGLNILISYEEVLANIIFITKILDFTFEDLEIAYLKKHEINYTRQASNY